MFCCMLLYVHSSIAVILMGKRELVALLNLSSWCLVMVEWLFLVVPWGCLRFVIVVFPDHTHYFWFTVKPAVAATSIKRDPPLSGHFKAPPPPPPPPPPRTILNANAPLLSVHLSNAASGRRNSPPNIKTVSLTANFNALMRPISIKFHQLTFLHRSYAWCN